MPVAADPAHPSRWHAHHQSVIRNIPRHHRARADERIAADGDAANDGGVGANGRAPPHQRGLKLALTLDLAAGIDDVGENHRGAAEDVVLQDDAVVHRDVVLDFHAIANDRVVVHEHVLAQIAAFADAGCGHDVAEVPDARVRADLRACIHHRGGMHEIGFFCHNSTP